jgi:drug/metabolite transporter (DMT)-like permease
MSSASDADVALRASAVGALVLAGFLLLGSWDGLYERIGLPQALPALAAQMGGAGFAALAYLLWNSASRPESAPTAAMTGVISLGGSALIIAGWLIFREPEADLGIDGSGTAILIVAAVVLGVLALALARVALGPRRV